MPLCIRKPVAAAFVRQAGTWEQERKIVTWNSTPVHSPHWLLPAGSMLDWITCSHKSNTTINMPTQKAAIAFTQMQRLCAPPHRT